MFGIGLLALLGVGVAVSMGGGGDDVEPEQDDVQEDMVTPPVEEGAVLSLSDFGFASEDEVDPDDLEQINAFIADLEANPSDDMTARIQEFLDELAGDEAGEDDGETPDGEEPVEEEPAEEEPSDEAEDDQTDAVVRPPMGEAFADPLRDAEEREELLPPDELVTVTNSSGTEVPDDVVITAGSGENAGDFIVTAPATANAIDVGYSPATTFEIVYNEATTSVTAGLNSDIEGPEGRLSSAVTTTELEDGSEIDLVTLTKRFDSSTDVRIEVDGSDVGEHVARIDLQNPDDTLTFQFETPTQGGYHLVHLDEEEESNGDSTVSSRAFVVYTNDANAPTAEEIAILAQNSGSVAGTVLVAEIYLGEDSVVLTRDDATNEVIEMVVENFTNEDPQILASTGWGSVTHFDDSQLNPSEEEEIVEDTGGGDFGEPDLPFTIPFF